MDVLPDDRWAKPGTANRSDQYSVILRSFFLARHYIMFDTSQGNLGIDYLDPFSFNNVVSVVHEAISSNCKTCKVRSRIQDMTFVVSEVAYRTKRSWCQKSHTGHDIRGVRSPIQDMTFVVSEVAYRT
ncbi:hypothetical protein Bpfe_026557 [Biomphalaria pfeifferi]|uniref:Uncharacterized protein n=1 Tax=Biomphalaria pfeifferi TaxID=112525 RepID=A0AAD8EYH2_BIOPF|nr:hypothetical protein Bpfe_026557 [Biomphalaria pfeifferi]